MIRIRLLALFALVSAFSIQAGLASGIRAEPKRPRVADPDARGAELRRWARSLKSSRIPMADRASEAELTDAGDPQLAPILAMTKRLYEWVTFVNQRRDPEHQLALTSAATQPAYPIETPRIYNLERILQQFEQCKAAAPPSARKVLMEGGDFVTELGVSDADFVAWAILLDRAYAVAERWNAFKDHLTQFAAFRRWDVRGYVALSREPDLEKSLQNWPELPSADQTRLKTALKSICFNTFASESTCAAKLAEAIAQKEILSFYRAFLPIARKAYDSFFQIDDPRSDAVWSVARPEEFRLPFVQPATETVRRFLTDNIEDEWRTPDWQLRLDFVTERPGTAHLVFQPGVVPNVVGDRITLDSHQPLEEYDSRWTIRHEFGHILGFPDCYHEFYDTSIRAMVNYQLDVDNLMCSRRGKLQPIHYQELRRVYLKAP